VRATNGTVHGPEDSVLRQAAPADRLFASGDRERLLPYLEDLPAEVYRDQEVDTVQLSISLLAELGVGGADWLRGLWGWVRARDGIIGSQMLSVVHAVWNGSRMPRCSEARTSCCCVTPCTIRSYWTGLRSS
jgi:hypothetical protein